MVWETKASSEVGCRHPDTCTTRSPRTAEQVSPSPSSHLSEAEVCVCVGVMMGYLDSKTSVQAQTPQGAPGQLRASVFQLHKMGS